MARFIEIAHVYNHTQERNNIQCEVDNYYHEYKLAHALRPE